MKKIFIFALLVCMQIRSAAYENNDLYIINNVRQPVFVRVRPDTPAPASGNILELPKDESIRVEHNLEKDGPLRLRIWPKEFANKLKVSDPENYAYEGIILSAANVAVITKTITAIGLSEVLKSQFGYVNSIKNLANGAKSSSSEPISIIFLQAKDIKAFKNKLSEFMSKWSSIKLDSLYETGQTIKKSGASFIPVIDIKTGRPEREKKSPQLDTRGLEELENELNRSPEIKAPSVMQAVFGKNA